MTMVDSSHLARLAEQGWLVVPDALDADELGRVRSVLDREVEAMRDRGQSTHDARLDPNDANIRVYTLPAVDEVFVDLLRRPSASSIVDSVLGPWIVANFTANIALPGSGRMRFHSDQSLAVPPPWLTPWALNIIWCLDDVYADNGATLYLPGSHRFTDFDDVPADADAHLVPFEAPAGSFIAMDGRLWHTSGANVTEDAQRRLLFAYYVSDFLRPQMNWEAVLPRDMKRGLDDDARRMLALGAAGNTRIGAERSALTS